MLKAKNSSISPAARPHFSDLTTEKPQIFFPGKSRKNQKIFNANFPVEPVRSETGLVVEAGESRLFIAPLLPVSQSILLTPIVGHGDNEPNVTNINCQIVAPSGREATFLNVFEAADINRAAMSRVSLVRAVGGNAEGADCQVGDVGWVTLFSAREDIITNAISYLLTNPGRHEHLVSNLEPKQTYHLTISDKAGNVLRSETVVSTDQGLVRFASEQSSEWQFNVSKAPVAPLMEITLTATGELVIKASLYPDATCMIETSTDLAEWTPAQTLSALSGISTWTTRPPSDLLPHFYRTVAR